MLSATIRKIIYKTIFKLYSLEDILKQQTMQILRQKEKKKHLNQVKRYCRLTFRLGIHLEWFLPDLI